MTETFSNFNLKTLLAGWLFPSIVSENRRLKRDRRDALRMARRDELTGLANRRAFEMARAKAEANPSLSFVVFDLNSFKAVNDLEGHAAGDLVLKRFAHVLKSEAAKIGLAERTFRYGGDEAVAIVPNAAAMDLRDRVEKVFGEFNVGGVSVSVSGAIGSTFEMADGWLASRKEQRKAGVSYR